MNTLGKKVKSSSVEDNLRKKPVFYKVLVDKIWVRETYNTDSSIVGSYNKGDVFRIYDTQGRFVKSNIGWVMERVDNSTVYLERIDKNSNEDIYNDVIKEQGIELDKDGNDVDNGVESSYKYLNDYTQSYLSNSKNSRINHAKDFISNVRGIHGIPYQFNELADTRLENSEYGRKYTEKIIAKMPLLLLTPGVPEFMGSFKKKDKYNVLQYLNQGKDEGMLDKLMQDSDEGKFYTFRFAYKEYYKCVNPILQRMSVLLGIGDKEIPSKSGKEALKTYNWENFTNDALTTFINSKETIGFYIDSETEISETFSNSTGDSMLKSATQNMSDMANELQFLLGGMAGVEFEALKAENRNTVLEDFNKFSDKYLSIFPKDLMSKLSSGFLTVASGGKLLFPEIWKDSEFTRTYSVKVKLRTPDADNFSWFMNIGVPLILLICMTAPRQLSSNAYQAPFLVRGFYKGFFNCDMGIITSMQISKGDKGKWTTAGLPMVVDVDFELKDLYQLMSITQDSGLTNFLKNTALLDYISNLCGININKPDLARTLDLYKAFAENKVMDTITFNGFIGVEQALSNALNGIYNKFLP